MFTKGMGPWALGEFSGATAPSICLNNIISYDIIIVVIIITIAITKIKTIVVTITIIIIIIYI